MRITAERVRQETGFDVTYVIGGIQIAAPDGSTRLVRGVYSQDGIIIQADNKRLSIDQIADHEIFHDKARQSPGLISQLGDRIVERYGQKEFDQIMDAYIKNLRGLIDIPENINQFEMDDALQDVLEEILADAYAGINVFSAHAERYNETVEQTLEERGIGRGTQFDAATERTTGPPNGSFEKFSVASAEESDIQGAYQDADGTWHFPDGSMDIDSYTKHLEENAAEQKAERMRNKSREEFTGSPALEKLGVKVDSSVGLYERLQSLIANDKAAKLVQKEMRRAERRLQATEAERNFASGVAAGIYTEGDIPASMDADKVMELADYYWAEKSTGANLIRQQRSDINQVLTEKMETIMQKVDVSKVKLPKGFTLNHRTPTRNMTTIFGDEIGGELNAFLFDPVAANESERYRFVNRMHDEVRAFEDSSGKKKTLTKEERAVVQQVIEGRAAAEMVANMEMSEAIQNAAQNIRNGQDAADAAQEFSLGSQERKIAEQYSRWLETKEVLESGRVDSVKVENAVKKYSEMFDQFYDATNEFLVAHGYEPIGFIKGYAPHIQPTENQNLLNKAFKAMGIPADVSALPTSIAGQTANYKPNKRWNPFHQHRIGDTTQYDIATAYENYVDYMSDIFYHTDDIMRVRQASNYFRRTYAPENIRENLSWAEELRYASTERKANFLRDNEVISRTSALSAEDIDRLMDEYVDKQYENIKNTTKYSNLVIWMDDYANNLAAKQLFADRNMERTVGRTSLNVSKKLARMFARAQVAGNLSSALNQTAQLPTILAENGSKYTAMALKDTVVGRLKKASWFQESDFLTEKAGIHYIVNTPGEMVTTALFKPLEFSDSLMATLAVRSRYLKEIQAGKSHAEAMKAADSYGRSVMGSRAKGSIPLAFQQKDIVSQMLHVFQVEAANSWEHLRVDYQQDFRQIASERGKSAAVRALAGVIVKMLLTAFLMNRGAEELYGGTPAPFDILGLFVNFVASGEGLTTNEYLKTMIDNGWEKLTGERLFDTDDSASGEDFDWGAAFESAGYTAGNDIPYLRNAMGLLGMGDETLPMPDIYGAGSNLVSAIRDHGVLSPETGKSVLSGVTEFLPGGRQISKTAQGIEAVARGGDYSGYGDSEKLKYPLPDTLRAKTQAILFGKNATNDSDHYYASGASALSVGQTKLYQELVAGGADRVDTYNAIQDYRAIANDDELESLEKGQQERDLISALDLSDEEKLTFYKGMNPTATSTAEKFQTLMNAGMSWEQVMNAYGKYAQLKADEDLKATQQATALAQWADEHYNTKQAEAIKEQFVFFSMVPAEASRYESMTGAGLSSEDAYNLTEILGALEPEAGKDSVSSLQKYRAVIDAGLTEKEQMTALSGLMGESEYAKLQAGYNYGVTPEVYVSCKELLPQYNADGNGNYKQEEVRAAIDALSGLSTDQKAALWQIQNKSWKPTNNPYSKSVGRKVYDALNTEVEESTPQELPNRDWSTVIGLPSLY